MVSCDDRVALTRMRRVRVRSCSFREVRRCPLSVSTGPSDACAFFAEHPCNMKEFKIYVGLNPDHMIQVLHAGLRDDAVPETFSITHVNRDGVPFPTRFIKIVPLS
jgi:hypothetical protein